MAGPISNAAARPDRPELRAELRAEDPLARAKQRAAQIRGDIGDMDEGTDEFATPTPPPGYQYEWKRKAVLGQEDTSYQSSVLRRGWEPVETARHPDMMPRDGRHPVIERKGMVLMERPKEINDDVRAAEHRKAVAQVRGKEAQLAAAPPSTFERSNKDASLVKVNRSYEPIPVPD